MNKEDLLEEIEYCGKADIKNIFDDLTNGASKSDSNEKIKLTENILVDLKKILTSLIEVDNDFAKKVQLSLDKEEKVPADIGAISSVTAITVSAICAILTMHANELRALYPNSKFTDCADIIKSLKLDQLLGFFKDE